MAPAGRSGLGADWAQSELANNNAANATLALDINLHLVNSIVEIPAGIPCSSFRLDAAVRIGGSRPNRVRGGFHRLPIVSPRAPGIMCLLFSQRRWIPSLSSI